MNSSWKARIILAIGVGVIIFGDLLGYGNDSDSSSESSNNSNRHTEQTQAMIDQRAAAIKEGSRSGKVEGFLFVFLCNVK